MPIKNNIAILEGIADAISVMGSEQATELVRSRLSPQISQMISDADKNIKDAIKLANESGVSEIIFLCSPAIRKPLYQFIAKNIGKYKVVSTAEIMQGYNVQGVAIIK